MKYQKKILITGADGFLGSHVCQLLKNNSIKFQKTSYKDLDVTNKDEVERKVRNIETIIHLAGNVRKKSQDTAEKHFDINATGTLNILEAARINKVKKIILASTLEVNEYPPSYYGQSKLLAETYCLQYSRNFGITCIILRFPYLYGVGMDESRIVPRIIKAAKSNQQITIKPGEFYMLYVKQAAEIIKSSLKAKKTTILNIFPNKKTTMEEIVETVKTYYPNLRVKYTLKQDLQDFIKK